MKSIWSVIMLSATTATSVCQVEIDKPLNFNGGSGDRKITNIETPVNDGDAANKKYVDDQIATNSGGTVRRIGDLYNGGIVVHVFGDETTEYGLVATLADVSIGIPWSNVTATEIGAGAQSQDDGLSNCGAITTQAGHTSSAAQLCLDYSGGGYNDWYLPSLNELKIINESVRGINRALQITGNTILSNNAYWSSSEAANTTAWRLSFTSGSLDDANKAFSLYVRCVRTYAE